MRKKTSTKKFSKYLLTHKITYHLCHSQGLSYNHHMLRTDLKILILFALLSFSVSAKVPGPGTGRIEVLSSNSDLCTSGPYRMVGEEGDQVLMVGTNITFSLPDTVSKQTESGPNGCSEAVRSELKNNLLTNTTETSKCPLKFRHLERKVTETLSFNEHTLTYQNLSAKTKCIFKWSGHEKK